MKIKVDENGNLLIVARDSENLSDYISIADNEDLINDPFKYKYVNGSIIKRNYAVLTTNRTDTNGNGKPDCPINQNHTITATFYNSDDTPDTSVNGTFNLLFSNQGGQSKTYTITITNGVGSIDLTTDWSGIYTVNIINDQTRYYNVLFIEFI